MRCPFLAIVCVLFFASSAPAQDAAAIKAIQDDVSSILLAVEKQDVNAIFDLIHPKAIEAAGGRPTLEVALAAAFKQFKEMGMSFKSVEFPAPPTFHKGTENEFVLIPTKTEMVLLGKTVDSRHFQLGARKIGESKWGYVDGSKLSKEMLAKLFPDFPKDVVLPEKSKTVRE